MTWIVGTMLAALLLGAVWVFNRLVRLRNQMRSAWADVDVQLTRRHDLVPPLVTAVKAYAGHERALLEAVTDLRDQALTIDGPARLAPVEAALERAVTRVLALEEAYPDLKASETFLQLQRDLVRIEEQLQYARRYYNGAVRDYNDAVQRVPDLLIAQAFGFGPGEFYQAHEDERPAVRVETTR
ncbi:MAG TPA: LemA family protein [Dokdonella sp.]|uniref:LemA family protein n=1 Tax=Dokdonella sp. TaxID=2291710 RepID=UPI002C4ACF56|nr:LemA family protein [Dokdonella sp.]HUD41453.1 LemA family protein [Dokdonella sp.]